MCFYYCFDSKGEYVDAIVTEVNNTPWGEQYCYVLADRSGTDSHRLKHFKLDKEFHVSPFMDMAVDYDWKFTDPADSLLVHMENRKDGDKFFEASLRLTRSEITGRSLARLLAGLSIDHYENGFRYLLASVTPVGEAMPGLRSPQKRQIDGGGTMMRSTSIDSEKFLAGTKKPSVSTSLARWLVRNRLSGLRTDRLIIVEGDDRWEFGDITGNAKLTARIIVHDPRCYGDCGLRRNHRCGRGLYEGLLDDG